MRTKTVAAGALVLLGAACTEDRRADPPPDTTPRRAQAAPCATSLWEGGADTSAATARRVMRHLVNRGTHGMSAQVRWTLPPDRCSMLVVEDPVSIEADPLPNGVLLANERGPVLFQRDSVWDVAPSPDWSRLAYSRAFGTRPNGSDDSVTVDSLLRPEWRRLGARIGLDPDVVRRSAFSCSGMTTMYCVVQLYVAELSVRDRDRALPVLAGWRVRWRADGSALFAGIPQGSSDRAPPKGWLVVDPASGSVRDTVGLADTVGIAPIAWSEGPMLSYDVALDLASRSELAIDSAVVASEGGWITVSWRAPNGRATSFRVGVGRALAATRGGRFIAAIVPARASPTQTWAYELAVYEVSR